VFTAAPNNRFHLTASPRGARLTAGEAQAFTRRPLAVRTMLGLNALLPSAWLSGSAARGIAG